MLRLTRLLSEPVAPPLFMRCANAIQPLKALGLNRGRPRLGEIGSRARPLREKVFYSTVSCTGEPAAYHQHGIKPPGIREAALVLRDASWPQSRKPEQNSCSGSDVTCGICARSVTQLDQLMGIRILRGRAALAGGQRWLSVWLLVPLARFLLQMARPITLSFRRLTRGW